MKRTDMVINMKEWREERKNRPGGSGELPMTEEDIAASDRALDARCKERNAQRAKAEAESKTSDKTE